MRLSEIYKLADGLAPKRLSDEFCRLTGGYDNSGILLDAECEVTKILFSLDFSTAAVDKAVEVGAQLIITHHPAIYAKIGSINVHTGDTLGKKLMKCIDHRISVISMHLNLDMADGGTDESLMDGVIAAIGGRLGDRKILSSPRFVEGSDGGYGRVFRIEPRRLWDIQKAVGVEFDAKRMRVYGDEETEIWRVATFCGSGGGAEEVLYAFKQGADLIVSSEFKHHALVLAEELGLAVIELTHYASENYGFKKYYEKMSRQTGLECVYHTDEGLL